MIWSARWRSSFKNRASPGSVANCCSTERCRYHSILWFKKEITDGAATAFEASFWESADNRPPGEIVTITRTISKIRVLAGISLSREQQLNSPCRLEAARSECSAGFSLDEGTNMPMPMGSSIANRLPVAVSHTFPSILLKIRRFIFTDSSFYKIKLSTSPRHSYPMSAVAGQRLRAAVLVDDVLDGAAADRAEADLISGEHDAVGARPVQALGLVAGALEGADPAGIFHPCQQASLRSLNLAEEFFHLFFRGAGGAQLPAALLVRSGLLLEGFLVPRRGERRIALYQVLPLEVGGVVQGSEVGLPGLRLFRRAGLVSDVGSEILVAQPAKVVSELVDKQIDGIRVVRRCGGLVVEDSSATVGALVHQDGQEIVRRRGSGIAQGAVVVGEDVPLGIECAVVRRKRRAAEDAGVRPADAALGRWQIEGADIEIGFAAVERLLAEERVHQAFCVGVEFLHFGGGVAVAENEQVHLLRGRAVLKKRPDAPTGRKIGRNDEARVRVNRGGPDFAEYVFGVALLQRHLHRPLRPGEAQRLMKRPPELLGLAGSLPLAVNGGEAAGVEQAIGRAVGDLEQVFPEVGVVCQARAAAGPWAVGDDAVERDVLFGGCAAVEVVHAHGAPGEVGVKVARARGGPAEGQQQRCAQAQDGKGDGCPDLERLLHEFPPEKTRISYTSE